MNNYFDGMHLVLMITVQNNYKITSDRVWANKYGIHIPEISSPTEFQWVKWENMKALSVTQELFRGGTIYRKILNEIITHT